MKKRWPRGQQKLQEIQQNITTNTTNIQYRQMNPNMQIIHRYEPYAVNHYNSNIKSSDIDHKSFPIAPLKRTETLQS